MTKFVLTNLPDVLILVLVEDGLRAKHAEYCRVAWQRLNPCSCGGWSQRINVVLLLGACARVLILVLVEDGLRGFDYGDKQDNKDVLILVLVEDGLRVRLVNTENGVYYRS